MENRELTQRIQLLSLVFSGEQIKMPQYPPIFVHFFDHKEAKEI